MDTIVEQFSELLKNRLNNSLIKIILFGSRARGDFQGWSDYDFAVIVNNRNPEIEDIVDTISGELLTKHSKLIGPIIWDEKEWEFKKKTPIGINIIRDGVDL